MRHVLVGSLVVLFCASACGGGGSDYNPPPTQPSPNPTAPVGSTVVNIPSGASNLGANAFGGPVTVRNGATVTWANADSLVHNVAANNGSFNSGTLAPGRNFNFTFSTNGTFPYHCNIHPTMTGSVTVQP
jgi:plastocyanin